MNSQKGFIQIPLLIAIIASILIFGGGGYFGVKQYQKYKTEKREKIRAEKEARQQKQIEKEVEANVLAESQRKSLEEMQQNMKKLQDEMVKNQATSQQKISVLENNISQANNQIIKARSNTEIVKKWRKNTAYINCYWGYVTDLNPKGWYLKSSGSAFLVMLNSIPTLVTNKHIVSDAKYGLADECDVTFPDSKFFYTTLPNGRPSYVLVGITFPEEGAFGQIKFNPDGSDVAYLSDLRGADKKSYESSSFSSLRDIAKSGNFACTSKINIGDPILILGYPSYGSGAGTAFDSTNDLEITATEGIISGKDGDYYTTSAKIEHGNSGGLAIDKTNDCYLGIPTAAFTGEIESLGRILPSSFIFK